MKTVIQVAREKLKMLNAETHEELPIIPYLMLTVFNEETPDDLGSKHV